MSAIGRYKMNQTVGTWHAAPDRGQRLASAVQGADPAPPTLLRGREPAKKTAPGPKWWRPEFDLEWARAREALRKEQDEARQSLGEDDDDEEADIDQRSDEELSEEAIANQGPPAHTAVKTWAARRGTETHDYYAVEETACRFGFGARMHYGKTFPCWSPALEGQLRRDWMEEHPENRDGWDEFREKVRRGWQYCKR